MNERGQLIRGIVCVLVFVLLALSFSDARADISAKQARKAITRMPGFELKNGAVRVSSVSASTASTAEVTASIQSVFRFEKNQEGLWRVAEIRTAPDTWEDIDLLGRVLGVNVITSDCNAPDSPRAALDPTVKRTRCLLGSLFGIDIPSDQVRIQEVAPFAVPLASRPSTTVIAWIQISARLVKEKKSDWKVTEVKTGKRDWVNVETVFAAVNDEKRKTARADLEVIAQALEKFRSERGYYWVADKESVLIDHLSPRYLSRVIRLDPWRQPYIYQGQRDRFTLTSTGPDRKEATGDDIILSGGAR
jgi:hypothetical protein